MADTVPKTRGQAAATADRLVELLLTQQDEKAREVFDDLARYFEEGDS